MNLVLALSGPIASGKSELSKRLAAVLQWPRVSFGDYIRSTARRRGLDPHRRTLQTLGELIIKEEGWEQYCRSVLGQIQWEHGQGFIVDGVRHSEALQRLKRIVCPMEVLLIYLELDESIRRSRLATRDNNVENNLQELEAHSTEIQVISILKNLADLIVAANKPVEDLTSEVLTWIRSRAST